MIIINDDGEETCIHRYPISEDDLSRLESYLRERECFCASFVESDPYAASLYLEQYCRDETESAFFLDRNIFSQVLDLVDGAPASDRNRLGAAVLAFAGCAESNVSVSLAIYEGANSGAGRDWREEKQRFEKASALSTRDWSALALGYADRIDCDRSVTGEELLMPDGFDPSGASSPFNFIYPALLRVAILQRRGGTRAHRMSSFIRWVHERWLFSFPATLFAMRCFSSQPFKGSLKNIGSADPEKVIKGIRNAAWDLSHITHHFSQTKSQGAENTLSVFCSADREIIALGNWLMPGMYGNDLYSQFMVREFGKPINDLYLRLSNQTDLPGRQANLRKGHMESYGRELIVELESQIRQKR